MSVLALGILSVACFGAGLAAPTNSTIQWSTCPQELVNNVTLLNPGTQITPFDCATLKVPLDYTDSTSPLLDLSLFKVNATRQPVLGSVLINFGGPGGTGALNLPAAAIQFAQIIGEQWNLVSWDPRGTGRTLPINCNIGAADSTTNNAKRDLGSGIASANLTSIFINGGWDQAEIVAAQCYATANQTGQYVSTAFTARDTIQIVDALGEDGLLRYYGWSYGTALGAYVSAMFPERVERVVLDANINPHTYQSGTYGNDLVDSDKAFIAFLQECINNKQQCSLAKYVNANTTDDLLEVINAIAQPVASNATSSVTAFGVYEGLQATIYNALYWPGKWPDLADEITAFLNPNTSQVAASTTSASTAAPTYDLSPNSLQAIRGADATFRTDDPAVYLPTVQYQGTVSHFNSIYTSLWISARWKITAREQYKGNFQALTRHPILFVNGEYDPIAPLVAAYNSSAGFTGSFVLPHSGYGHGLYADPSQCANNYIQAYFKNGTLPAAGSHCTPDYGPWQYAQILAAAANSTSTSSPSSTANPTPSIYRSDAAPKRLNMLQGAVLLMTFTLFIVM